MSGYYLNFYPSACHIVTWAVNEENAPAGIQWRENSRATVLGPETALGNMHTTLCPNSLAN